MLIDVKILRTVIVSVIAGLALSFPWIDLGDLIPFLLPALLGVTLAWLFPDFGLLIRAVILCGSVIVPAFLGISWGLATGRNFDSNRSEIAITLGVQLFSAVVTFISTWQVLKIRIGTLPQNKRFILITSIVFGTVGIIISVTHAFLGRYAFDPFGYDLQVVLGAPALAVGKIIGMDEGANDWVWVLLEIGLDTSISIITGGLLGLIIHCFSFGRDVSQIRKASMIISVPAVLFTIFWCVMFICPSIVSTKSAELCGQVLFYLTWIGLGLAVILFLRTRYSRDTVVCLVLNLVGLAMHFFGPFVWWHLR